MKLPLRRNEAKTPQPFEEKTRGAYRREAASPALHRELSSYDCVVIKSRINRDNSMVGPDFDYWRQERERLLNIEDNNPEIGGYLAAIDLILDFEQRLKNGPPSLHGMENG